MKAVLVISHGSRSPKTKQEVRALVETLKEKSAVDIIEYAFLELESPSIPEGIDLCVNQGADDVIILLNFLNSGRHVDEDIPGIIRASKEKHPKVKMRVTEPVGQHVGIAELFLDIINDRHQFS